MIIHFNTIDMCVLGWQMTLTISSMVPMHLRSHNHHLWLLFDVIIQYLSCIFENFWVACNSYLGSGNGYVLLLYCHFAASAPLNFLLPTSSRKKIYNPNYDFCHTTKYVLVRWFDKMARSWSSFFADGWLNYVSINKGCSMDSVLNM